MIFDHIIEREMQNPVKPFQKAIRLSVQSTAVVVYDETVERSRQEAHRHAMEALRGQVYGELSDIVEELARLADRGGQWEHERTKELLAQARRIMKVPT